MKRSILTAWAALVALLLAGCADKAETATSSVRIMPTIETRVTGLYFDAGDRTGQTAMMDGSGPYVENRMVTYTG